ATSGVAVGMVVPKLGRKEREGEAPVVEGPVPLRVLCRARSLDRHAGEVRVGLRAGPPPAKLDRASLVPSKAPEIDPARMSTLAVPAVENAVEVFATLPSTVTVKPGEYGDFVVYATQNVEVTACAVVPPLGAQRPAPASAAGRRGGKDAPLNPPPLRPAADDVSHRLGAGEAQVHLAVAAVEDVRAAERGPRDMDATVDDHREEAAVHD